MVVGCTNIDCGDLRGDGFHNNTCFLFNKDGHGKILDVKCAVCGDISYVQHFPCSVRRTITLPDDSCEAMVSEVGMHLPTCRGSRHKSDAGEAVDRVKKHFLGGVKTVK